MAYKLSGLPIEKDQRTLSSHPVLSIPCTMASTFCFLLSIFLLVVATSSSEMSPEDYWNKLLPKTPIPTSLHAFLPTTGASYPSQKKHAALSLLASKSILWQSYKFGTTPDQVKKEHDTGFLFLKENLKPGSKTKKLDLEKKEQETAREWPALLPRQEAGTFPFSTSKLRDILQRFSMDPNSADALTVRHTLENCERGANEGEISYCATSLESMVDFVVSQLKTNDVQLLTYSFLNKEERETKSRVYTVQPGVVELAAQTTVACHVQSYPYAVFYCHTVPKTKTYIVPLVAEEDGTRVRAGAVCHTDTSSWNKNHAAMLALGIKPGTPLCHFLSHGHVVFVPNSALKMSTVRRSPTPA
ncbi:BURP domain-containing protein 5-like [Nymphaea colorata]|nr:BURP domain-containing protein 5-like [Nymphaea colorata]